MCEGKTFKAFTNNALFKCFLAVFILGIILIPTSVNAESKNIDGVTYTYTVNENDEITITKAVLDTGVTEVSIPGTIGGNTVTTLGTQAFYNCDTLVKVTIPKEIITIGVISNSNYDGAFENCDKLNTVIFEDESNLTTLGTYTFYNSTLLTNITLPEGVITIGSRAFYNCDRLTNIKLPEGVTSIGDDAFYDCDGLINITLPEGITNIGQSVFYSCSALKEVVIPSTVTSISNSTFSYCSALTDITIPEGVITIGSRAFYNCDRLTNIKLPEGVTSIGDDAFYDCSALKEIVIPSTVTSIGSSAFYYCSVLIEIVIPSTVTSIGSSAFSYCSKLTTVEFAENSNLTTIGNAAFSSCNALKVIELPSQLMTIEDYAFLNCIRLDSITIPQNLKTIGKAAFGSCTNLSNVNVSEENENFISIDNVIFTKDGHELVIYPAGKKDDSYTIAKEITKIKNGAFYGNINISKVIFTNAESLSSIGAESFYKCTYINNIILPEGVTSIGSKVFYDCDTLTEIVIPSSVTSIGDGAFYSCNSLTNITIPNSVTSIGSSMFYECNKLTNIVISSGIKKIASSAFYNCTSLSSIIIPEGATSIGGSAFYNCTSLRSITIPNSVTSIGSYAFYNCYKLESATIPPSVTVIDYYTFYNCNALTNITLPEGVTRIETHAFYNCNKLTNIIIPEKVTNIGSYAFYNCDTLTNITIPKNVSTIGYYAFSHCDNLEIVEFVENNKLTLLEEYMFYNCKSLTSVILNLNSLKTIEYEVFYNCTSLTSITIPASVTTIQYDIFENCSNLETVIFEDNSKIETISESSFVGCNKLNDISITNEIENGKYKIIDGALYDTINKKLIIYPQNKTDQTEYIVPSGITAIGEYAFRNNTLLKINIPSSVTNIGTSSFNGRNADLVIACRQNSRAFNYAKYYNINCEISQFEAVISYNQTELTREPVTAIITLNEKLSDETKTKLEEENWLYTEDLLKIEKVYEKNTDGVETLNIIDWLGNQLNVYVSITNIDNEMPTLNIVYTPGELTRESVNVLVLANEALSKEVAIIENGEIVRTEEWEHLIELTPSMLTCNFDENINMNIKVKDLAGNYSEVTPIAITNIKTKIATPEIIYTPTKEEGITNKNVMAKVSFENTSEEQIEFINSADEITKEGLNAQYEFEENGKYTIYYKDIAENQENITLEVDWIDKANPKIEGVEDGKTYTRKVEIKVVDENLSEVTIIKDNETIINYEEGMEIEEIGSYQITAKDSATNTSEVNFTIKKEIIKVEGITLNQNNIEMKPEESISLEATITPENATNKNIIWTSTNEEVATVTNGVVIAKEVGETTILAKTEDGEKTAYCHVKVEKEVDLQGPTIKEVKTTPTTWTNRNVEIEIIAEDENGLAEVPYSINGKTWTNEKLEIKENGKYEIQVKDIFGNITVHEIEISNIDKISPKIEGVENNKTYTRKVEIKVVDENISEVKIVKDNEEVLNYEEGMEIEGIGNYKVTAKDAATNTTEVNFTIEKEIIKVQGISLNTNKVEMKPEESISLEATITPENATNKNIIWTTTNEKVATVDNGIITAKEVGETIILAMTEDGEKATYCHVKVEKEVDLQGPTITEIKITPETWTNGNVEIEMIAEDENGLAVSPYSLDTKTWTNEKLIVAQNGKYDLHVKDVFGNITVHEIEINNIDKTNPKIEGVENGKTYTRKVEIKVVDENLSEVIIVKDNNTTINYEEGMEIDAIGQYKITAIDEATNSSEVNFVIEKEIIKVEGISLNVNNLEMRPEESISLEATITPENATNKNIIWTSTNPEVATVSNGVVIAKNVGETTILAKTEDGEKTVYCQVKVEKEVDLQGPSITEVKITPEIWTNGNVEIEVIAEDENGLAVSPYSLDTKTWTNEKLTVTQNGNYELHVKDVFGNITVEEIEINNIDKTNPELKVEVANNDKVSKTKEVTITAKDALSGLNERNEYKYCITNNPEVQNEEWLDYELNKTFEIGEGKTGEYYLHVKGITDNAGNETKIEITKITLDNTAPKVLVNNSEGETAHKTATIKVEEENVYEIVVMKDGQEIEYKENEILKDIGNYEIIVKDVAGNESKVKFEISEFITNEKYTTYEEEGIWYIGNISPETSKERFIENLETNITGIEVKTKEQENLTEGKYVGTGMTTTIQGVEYILVVKGDTTGDGKANGQDALAILFHREGKMLLEGEQIKAADLNEDGKINGMDALLLLLHRERQEGYIL